MKKNGFTLAEVLVTLGIIGVIAALTLPTFTQSTNMAKIGPMLGKAKSSFEQATTAMLDEAHSDSLTTAMLCPDNNPDCTTNQRVAATSAMQHFLFNLNHYLKGSRTTGTYTSDDGATYTFKNFIENPTSSPYPHDEKIMSEVMIDINGAQAPNRDSKDRFYFEMRNDGSLVPYGQDTWETLCAKNTEPNEAKTCAGHIFANGLKAEYK